MGFWSRLWGGGKKSEGEAAASGNESAASPSADGSVRETFGFSPTDPILCDQPAGERAYIARLRCPGGHRIRGPRRGSMTGKCTDPKHHATLIDMPGIDPARECIVDCYDLICESGEYSCILYFDMYHPNPPQQPAPRGLTKA